jgi:hypothetical protein
LSRASVARKEERRHSAGEERRVEGMRVTSAASLPQSKVTAPP